MGRGILGWRQVMPGWVNDPVWIHDSRKDREGRGVSGYPPWAYIGWRAEKGWIGLNKNIYVTISDRD